MRINRPRWTFFSERHPEQGRFGGSPCSTLDVCSDAVQQKLLTQRSKNIRRNKERLSGQQPRPESSKHLTNPDVKSKLHHLPKHSCVTAVMGRRLLRPARIWRRTGLFSISYSHMQNGHFILWNLHTRGEVMRENNEQAGEKVWKQEGDERGETVFSPDSSDSSVTGSDSLAHACHSSQPLGDRLYVSVPESSDFSESPCVHFYLSILAYCMC